MEEFACFKWMTLNEIPSWKDVKPCLEYLIGKLVDVDNAKCFDQICNLKQFVESYLRNEEFVKLPTHKKWCKLIFRSVYIYIYIFFTAVFVDNMVKNVLVSFFIFVRGCDIC